MEFPLKSIMDDVTVLSLHWLEPLVRGKALVLYKLESNPPPESKPLLESSPPPYNVFLMDKSVIKTLFLKVTPGLTIQIIQ